MPHAENTWLYRTDRFAGRILQITTCLLLVWLALFLLYALLRHWGITLDTTACWPSLLLIYKNTCYACAGIFVICVLCRIILSPFVKSEEQEDFEQKIDYILQQKEQQKVQKLPISSEFSPLLDTTKEQEERIKNILREVPSHPDKPDWINMACVAQYLTALDRLGKINLKNKRDLRLWVAQVTGKNVPDSGHFNEAIPSDARKKVTEAVKEWKSLLPDL